MIRNDNLNDNAWFPLDRNRIMKSCDPSKSEMTTRRFVRIYDKNLLSYKSEAILVRFFISILIDLSTVR